MIVLLESVHPDALALLTRADEVRVELVKTSAGLQFVGKVRWRELRPALMRRAPSPMRVR